MLRNITHFINNREINIRCEKRLVRYLQHLRHDCLSQIGRRMTKRSSASTTTRGFGIRKAYQYCDSLQTMQYNKPWDIDSQPAMVD